MAAIGKVDEANSAIGVARAAIPADHAFAAILVRIQNELFDLGADIATPSGIDGALRIVDAQVARLETDIDAVNEALALLTSFILPGGSPDAAALRLARAVASHQRLDRRRLVVVVVVDVGVRETLQALCHPVDPALEGGLLLRAVVRPQRLVVAVGRGAAEQVLEPIGTPVRIALDVEEDVAAFGIPASLPCRR